MKLIVKLLCGMVLGLLVGQYAPLAISRLFATFESLFSHLLEFTIPFIIVFFIANGIASLTRNSGKTLGITVGLSYMSTITAGLLAAIVGLYMSRYYGDAVTQTTLVTQDKLVPYFTIQLPALLDVMSALVVAFIFGVGAQASNSTTLQQIAKEGAQVIELLLKKIIIPLLPLYIAAVFTNMAHAGSVSSTLETYGFVLLLAIGLHWVYLIILLCVSAVISGYNPMKVLSSMLPAYFTAVGTMSSSATIPISLKQTQSFLRHPRIAEFTVPLCATIHLAGSTITLVSCTIAVMVMNNQHIPHLSGLIPFILMLGIIMVAAPGVPGGGVIAALGILSSMLGFSEDMLALMIALYIAQDSFGTACNVMGDAAIAMMVEKCCEGKG